MDAADYLRLLRSYWVLLLLLVFLGTSVAGLWSQLATPVYASQVTFYISTPNNNGDTAFGSLQYAQRQANSYAELLKSERLAEMVVSSAHLNLTPQAVMNRISAVVPLNTVLVEATVTDTSRSRSRTIASALASDFGGFVSGLDNTGRSPTVTLNVVSGPITSDSAISPRKKLNLLVGALAGLVVAVAVALWLDRRNRLAKQRPSRGGSH